MKTNTSTSDYGLSCLNYVANYPVDSAEQEPLMSIVKDCNQIANDHDFECVQVDIYQHGDSIHHAGINCGSFLK